MLEGGIRMLTVDSMGMQLKGLGGSEPCGHERAEIMLDRLEHLLPIPTGAEVERWKERVIQRGEKDEKNGDMETFLCITYTDKVSDRESIPKGMLGCTFRWAM